MTKLVTDLKNMIMCHVNIYRSALRALFFVFNKKSCEGGYGLAFELLNETKKERENAE